jgi:uncharacterized protein YfaS (alpha-2-macroglobulin family)
MYNQLQNTGNTPVRSPLNVFMFGLLLLFVSLWTSSFSSCQQRTKPKQIIMSTSDYTALWKEVDAMEREKGLPKSALELTEQIYQKALAESNTENRVRASLYRAKYMVQLNENGIALAIADLEHEIAIAQAPDKQILHSQIAQIYRTYYENELYEITNRTEVQGDTSTNILTWSAAQFERRIFQHYKASLTLSKEMTHVPASQFGALITPLSESNPAGHQIWSEIGVVLQRRALNYFSQSSSFLATDASTTFRLNDQVALAPAGFFVSHTFKTTDTTSLQYQALLIYQQIYAENLDVSDQAVYIFTDIDRLRFVRGIIEMEQSEKYENTLLALEKLYKNQQKSPYSAFIAHEIAQVYQERSALYQPNDLSTASYKNDLKNAITYLKQGIEKNKDGNGAALCRISLTALEAKYLYLVTEGPYLPNKPGLFGLKFKNIDQLHFRVISWDENKQKELNQIQDQESRWAFMSNQNPIKTWSDKITDPKDYFSHDSELEFPAMPAGSYQILACHDDQFKDRSASFAVPITVSNIQIVNYNHNGKLKFVVIDRTTGAPINDASISVYAVTWLYQPEYQMVKSLVASGKTNADGIFGLTVNAQTAYLATVKHNGEEISTEQIGVNGEVYDYTQSQVHFFLDRAIYRPGQIVYFKGLAMRTGKQSRSSIIANQAVTVSLMDANYQEVAKQTFTTNTFGTIQGSFIAPSTGLMGMMQLVVNRQSAQDIGGNQSFQVEEYKRPRFEVKIKAPAQAIVVGDQVVMNGQALNYAGNAVDGAQVRYKVVRRAQFPFCGWWRWVPTIPEAVIVTGETMTDAEGRFEVKFAAEAAPITDKKWQPVFTYSLTADVIDLSGETRTGQGSMDVAYQTIQIKTNLSSLIDIAQLKKVEINTTDFNENKLAVSGTVSIEKLSKPKLYLHTRAWAEPDIWLLPMATYQKNHPAFGTETDLDPTKWPVIGQAKTMTFKTDTASAKLDLVSEGGMEVGEKYRVTTKAKDAKGRETILTEICGVTDLKNPSKTLEITGEPVFDRKEAQPDETATFWAGNSNGIKQYLVVIERQNNVESARWHKLGSQTAASIAVPVSSKDHSAIYMHCIGLSNGFVQKYQVVLPVPDQSRELKISFETFRDQLAPGAEEVWKLRISGNNKDAVAAEMVAAMYDASLDQFLSHQWNIPYAETNQYAKVDYQFIAQVMGGMEFSTYLDQVSGQYPIPPDFELFDFPLYGGYNRKHMRTMAESAAPGAVDGVRVSVPTATSAKMNTQVDYESYDATNIVKEEEKNGGANSTKSPSSTSVRTNLKETVFFFPQLLTDANGDILIQFTMNEALTRWKFMAFAHTKDLKMALAEREVVTQKELMVLPNAPRFFRAGDTFSFSGKVSNLTKEAMNGKVKLELFDAITMQPLDAQLGLKTPEMSFSAAAGQSVPVAFALTLPEIPPATTILWRMRAEAGVWADGEENVLPMLQNRMLVTETLPITVRGGQSKQFNFDALRTTQSSTLTHHKYTVEFTSNPAWYAVRALPYLMETTNDCSEQVFSRMYANALASTVANRNPAIRKVYDSWKRNGALKSNLTKNQELKTALLEETPWVLEAQSEEQQQEHIALLFDLSRIADEQANAINKLSATQNGEGAWPWFAGGRSDEFMTRYITIGFRRLKGLNALDNPKIKTGIASMESKAVKYLDAKYLEKYNKWLRDTEKNPQLRITATVDASDLYHLYLHSFEPKQIGQEMSVPTTFHIKQLGITWQKQSLYEQALSALVLHRFGKTDQATAIVKSLKERALKSEELGMYWPYEQGYYWYQMPIETQAMMVEVMQEVANDRSTADELRIWLLKNKQTTNWKTSKETAEAVYAFLIGNEKWISPTKTIAVNIGKKPLKPQQIEDATGYFKEVWQGTQVEKQLGDIGVQNPNEGIAWGAAYWQYFEDLDKIKSYNTKGLQIVKEVYKVTGDKLTVINNGNRLKPGDKLKIRIVITADRPYEYVHLKDMRAAGFEPINLLSGYRWGNGLGYYESTRDLASNFFIDQLPKGTHVFEYPLVVNHKGDFSNGITTIQCMYAPEFGGHSKGMRLVVE